MRVDRGIGLRTIFSVVALILSSFATLDAARAEDKTYVMKLGTATINESQHEWCKRFRRHGPKGLRRQNQRRDLSGKPVGAIPRQIEGVQFGAIQGYVGPPEFLVWDRRPLRTDVHARPRYRPCARIRVGNDPELQKLMLALRRRQGDPRRRFIHLAAVIGHRPRADRSPRRLHRQETSRVCRRHAAGNGQIAGCVASGDDAR